MGEQREKQLIEIQKSSIVTAAAVTVWQTLDCQEVIQCICTEFPGLL